MSNTVLRLGIDNGVSGTLAGISEDLKFSFFQPTPAFHELDYTKEARNIGRIDRKELAKLLTGLKELFSIRAVLEHPFHAPSPKMQRAAISGARAFEATMNVLNDLDIKIVRVVDSKEWQKALLPSGVKGTPALKKASLDVGLQMFPEFREAITKHGDADSLLMAEWARRERL